MMDAELYQAISARRSVRRYDRASLGADTLAEVRRMAAAVRPLEPGHRYDLQWGDVAPGRDLVGPLGGCGRVVNPPHYLLPYATGGRHVLTGLGFLAEQIAVRLTMMSLGSCFVGCLGRVEAVRAEFSLPAGAQAAAFLIFGRPSTGAGGRAFNALIRAAVGAAHKLPVERIYHDDTFARPTSPPAQLAPLIEAARHAPSAVDAQPWRFLWHDARLHLFVQRRNPRYGGSATAQCNLHDGGICMANVSLALMALGREGHWELYDGAEPGIPDHPEGMLPLAWLDLD